MKKYKLCECYKDFEEKLNKHYTERGETLTEKFNAQDKCFIIDEGAVGHGIAVIFEARTKRGAKSSKKITAKVTCQYCTFCGKSMAMETEDTEDVKCEEKI